MTLEAILKQNPDGVSIKARGNDYTPAYFKTGFFVSLTDNETRGIGYEIIIDQLHKLARQLHIKTYFYGYWKDAKTSKEYLDLSIHIQSKREAVILGQVFNQKAIFDCKESDSIYL